MVRLLRVTALAAILSGCAIGELILPAPADEWQASWLLYERSGSTLVIGVEDSCAEIRRVDVEESPEGVNVVAYAGDDGEDICPMARHWRVVTVRLDSALADRTLTGCLPEERPVGEALDCGAISSE